jgi:DNA-binding MarR family transcriptional regulator
MRSVQEIAEEIAVVGPRIGRRFMADLSFVADLPSAQLFVMGMLSSNGPMRGCDISHELKVSAPTVSGIIDRLEGVGYVSRQANKEDRRCVTVSLTKAGQKIALKMRAALVSRWVDVLSKLSREDADKYLELVKKINEAL